MHTNRHTPQFKSWGICKTGLGFHAQSSQTGSYSNLVDQNQDIAEVFLREVLGMPVNFARKHELIHESIGTFVAELVRCLNVLEAAEGRSADVSVFQRFERYRANPGIAAEIKLVMDSMSAYVGEVSVDDRA